MKGAFSLLVIGLFCIGCGPHKMAEVLKQIPTNWPADEGVNFTFNVDDTTHAYNVILEIKHQESFGYQNLYTNIITNFPDGETAESIVSLDVRKKSGTSHGNCNGTTCTVPFLIQKDVYFEQLGRYGITIFQHSRKDTIGGLRSANLIVQQTDSQD